MYKAYKFKDIIKWRQGKRKAGYPGGFEFLAPSNKEKPRLTEKRHLAILSRRRNTEAAARRVAYIPMINEYNILKVNALSRSHSANLITCTDRHDVERPVSKFAASCFRSCPIAFCKSCIAGPDTQSA